MKKLASILVVGLMALMFASCSAGDDAGVMSIEDVPETVDNTKVFMFKDVATHEGVSGAYAIKIKTVKGIKYCALLGAGSEAFFSMDEKSDLPRPMYETYATNIPMREGVNIVWVVISVNIVFLVEQYKIHYQGDMLHGDDILHCTEIEIINKF